MTTAEKPMRRMAVLIVVALSTACASQPQRDEGQDRAAVDIIRLEFEAGENAGDLARMTRHLAADGGIDRARRPVHAVAAAGLLRAPVQGDL